MSEPDDDLSRDQAFEASLLRAAKGYRPRSSAKGRVLAGLGLAAGTATATTSKAALVAGVLKSLVATKTGVVVVALALAGAVAGGAYVATNAGGARVQEAAPSGLVALPNPSPPVSPSLGATRREGPAVAADGGAEQASSEVPAAPTDGGAAHAMAGALRSPRGEPRSPFPGEAPASAAREEEDTLAAELALLDQARTAERERRYDDALAAIGEHERRFPRGKLAQQAELVRIETLAAVGRRAEARQRAQRFLASYPQSILAGRARDLLASLEREAGP